MKELTINNEVLNQSVIHIIKDKRKSDWKIDPVCSSLGVIDNLYNLYKDGFLFGRVFRVWNNDISQFDLYLITYERYRYIRNEKRRLRNIPLLNMKMDTVYKLEEYYYNRGWVERTKVRLVNMINRVRVPVAMLFKELVYDYMKGN